MCQSSYIEQILKRFNMVECKPLTMPMMTQSASISHDATSAGDHDSAVTRFPYREAVGSLMWLAIATRPDIMYSVTYHSQFLENPTQGHVESLKRVFRYLKGTKDYKLTYGGGNGVGLVGASGTG